MTNSEVVQTPAAEIDAIAGVGLDGLFTLPAVIQTDPDLRALGEALVRQFRVESFGIPMTTNQLQLAAQVINETLMLKYYEQHGFPTAGGRAESREREIKRTHLDYVKEWNNLLAKSQEKILATTVEEFKGIILAYVKTIEDDAQRRAALKFFQDSFSRLGY